MTSEDRADQLAAHNYWDNLLALRDEQRAQRKNGVQIIKRRDLPLEEKRQGLMRWYMHPDIKDTVLSTYLCFEQEIPPNSRSGRLKFQGGQVIYIVAGRGYTLLDGVKHRWAAGDVINLPLRRGGIVVQHFNDDPQEPARFIAVEPNLYACTSVDRGSGFEQLEDAPGYHRG
jgi:hypothetical protein